MRSFLKRLIAQKQEATILWGRLNSALGLRVGRLWRCSSRLLLLLLAFAAWCSEAATHSLRRPGVVFTGAPPSCIRDYVKPCAGRNSYHHVLCEGSRRHAGIGLGHWAAESRSRGAPLFHQWTSLVLAIMFKHWWQSWIICTALIGASVTLFLDVATFFDIR